MTPDAPAPKTYEVLAEAFHVEGTEACFALLGDANMHWANALSEKTRMIYLRHEHCAVAAAAAYARVSGNVGVATVTCGPGLTQIMTALPAAVRARIPVVVFAGEAPLTKAWYNQQIDQRPFVEACGARYIALHHPSQMRENIRAAFRSAREDGIPTVVGVPFDLQSQSWTGPASDVPTPQLSPQRVRPDPTAVTDIADIINEAERIVVLAGLGARHAVTECIALADKTGALLGTTLPARGLFHDHPFEIGIIGGFSPEPAREILQTADLVIGIGASLSSHTFDGGKLCPNADTVHVDLAPRHTNQGRESAQHLLQGDAAEAVGALTEKVAPRAGWRSNEIQSQIAVFKSPEIRPSKVPHDPANLVAALDDAVPKDWFCINSSGHCSYFTASMFGRTADNFLTIREFGAIGNGISFAIGAAVARPDQQIVLFDGDGSLLMHVQELETIRRHGLNILICVLNDAGYGSEIHKLRADGLSEEGAVFDDCDFARLAQGFGISGQRITSLDALPDALSHLSGATVLDFPIDANVASPQIHRVHPPKS